MLCELGMARRPHHLRAPVFQLATHGDRSFAFHRACNRGHMEKCSGRSQRNPHQHRRHRLLAQRDPYRSQLRRYQHPSSVLSTAIEEPVIAIWSSAVCQLPVTPMRLRADSSLFSVSPRLRGRFFICAHLRKSAANSHLPLSVISLSRLHHHVTNSLLCLRGQLHLDRAILPFWPLCGRMISQGVAHPQIVNQ
jgi:hypothetical protein